MGGDQIVQFKAWYPHRIVERGPDEDPMIFVWPAPRVKFLWCRARLSGGRREAVFGEREPRVGDVWLLRGTNDLFFVGPESTVEETYVYADWDCLEMFTETEVAMFFTQLFQPGPGGQAVPPPVGARSAIDRILGDDSPV